MGTTRVIRQGDVMLIPITHVPRGWKPTETGLTVVGEGEHTHVLPKAQVLVLDRHTVDWEWLNTHPSDADRQVVKLDEPDVLTHDEHPSVDVPAGIYEVRQAREWGRPRFSAD